MRYRFALRCPSFFALNSQSGFSLVQVMVAFGLMGGLAVMMMRLMENQNKQQKSIELRSEQIEIKNIILKALENQQACEATFLGMSPGDEIKQIRLSSDFSLAPFAETGVKFKAYNVYIKRMYLLTREEEAELAKQIQQSGGSFNPTLPRTPDGYGTATLRVTFVKNIGAVNDSNKTHNFFGAKETAIDIQVLGYFYDREVVKAFPVDDKNALMESCVLKASEKGVNCTSKPELCSVWNFEGKLIDKADDIDDAVDVDGGGSISLADCHFIRLNSPFMACHSL